MSYTVTPYRFNPPGPSFDLTLHEKAIWPKTFIAVANLDNYPDRHEVLGLEFYIDHRLYENHGTHWNAKYYDNDTGRLVFESDFDIPEPSTSQYTYWSWYRIYSWVGHSSWEIYSRMTIRVDVTVTSNILPTETYVRYFAVTSVQPPPLEVICTPGEKKCIGTNLYECNADGTDWVLSERDSPICVGQGACPDFWTDPVGAVMCWILTGFENLLGLISGGFVTLILNVKNFIDSFSTSVSNFFGDVKSSIEDAIGGAIATIQDVTASISTGISNWWNDQVVILQRGWDNTVTGIQKWFNDQITILQRGWDKVITGIQKWFNDQITILQRGWDKVIGDIQHWFSEQIAILQRGWNNVVTGIQDWISDQIEILQRGWDNVVSGIGDFVTNTIAVMNELLVAQIAIVNDFFTEAINNTVDFINTRLGEMTSWTLNIIPEVVSGMFDWAKPIVKPIQDAVGFLESIVASITRTYPEDPEIKEHTRKQQELKDEIRRKIEEL